jgi:hypothetical protein
MKTNTERHPDFCVFILTHGGPDSVLTYDTLRDNGYDGPIHLVIDNEDKTAYKYAKRFGQENVEMFDKAAVAEQVDEFDNFDDRRAILYARNACFDIAQRLGYTYFLELDDDYPYFKYRMNDKFEHPSTCPYIRRTMGDMIYATLEFYKSIPVASIAFSQGGDWFGGGAQFGNPPKRKAMNSFFCSTERRFQFSGRINEDVNTYTRLQSQGNVFFTLPHVQLDQTITQKAKGGMTEIYLDGGTYVKSFYTILCSPNCVTIEVMGRTNRRLHHRIDWDTAVPKDY